MYNEILGPSAEFIVWAQGGKCHVGQAPFPYLHPTPDPTQGRLRLPAEQAGELRLSLSPPPGSPLTTVALPSPGLTHLGDWLFSIPQHEVALPQQETEV